jgi:hypothetical protein
LFLLMKGRGTPYEKSWLKLAKSMALLNGS